MAEETESAVLELFRRIRADIAGLREEVVELKLRQSAVEQGLGNVSVQIGQLQISLGSYQRRADRTEMRAESSDTRLDRLEHKTESTEARLARIEERLKLMDA